MQLVKQVFELVGIYILHNEPTCALNYVRPFPSWEGKKTKTLVIKSIYQITIYLFDKIYIYIFFNFSLLQKQVLET